MIYQINYFHPSSSNSYYVPFIKMEDNSYYLKKLVLENGLTKRINNYDRRHYLNCIDGIVVDKKLDDEYLDLLFSFGYEQILEARKVNNSSYRRVERLKDRVTSYLLRGHCIFATLTFNDETLANTNKATRRKYVQRFLKSQSKYYVANIDYGSDHQYIDRHGNARQATKREHYHALVVIDSMGDNWEYGHILREHVRIDDNTSKLISKYISKLTNHAIKETTKRNLYIYSRNK